jgi:2-polyprenyl-3-methyl-5-hydroxy-6-metoxy-1,4-benzoquinol methylase
MERMQQQLQEQMYEFPYHYLPHFGDYREPRIFRALSWGFDYLVWLNAALDEIRAISPRSILDIGCGDGRLLGLLGDVCPVRMGSDFSEKAISFAKAFHPEIEWHTGSLDSISQTFECVTLMEVMEHIPDQDIQAFVRSVSEKLAAGGTLIVTVPTICEPLNPKHFRHYSLSLLEQQIGGAFEVERVRYFCRRSHWFSKLNALVYNDLYVLNSGFLLSWIWNLYKKTFYHAKESDGRHMVVVARKR